MRSGFAGEHPTAPITWAWCLRPYFCQNLGIDISAVPWVRKLCEVGWNVLKGFPFGCCLEKSGQIHFLLKQQESKGLILLISRQLISYLLSSFPNNISCAESFIFIWIASKQSWEHVSADVSPQHLQRTNGHQAWPLPWWKFVWSGFQAWTLCKTWGPLHNWVAATYLKNI